MVARGELKGISPGYSVSEWEISGLLDCVGGAGQFIDGALPREDPPVHAGGFFFVP